MRNGLANLTGKNMRTTGASAMLLMVLGLAVTLASCAPSIPHALEGRKDCITCHGQNGVKPYPEWHAKRDSGNDDCSHCHDVKIKG